MDNQTMVNEMIAKGRKALAELESYSQEQIDELCRISGVKVPKAVEDIRTAPVLHDKVIETNEMRQAVKEFLGM